MRLEDIGFYTLSDNRARNAGLRSSLKRCELLLTGRCNFHCPYCKAIGSPDLSYNDARTIVKSWANQGLENIRFSGGEPTLWKHLTELVYFTKSSGIRRIAISTNGSAPHELYEKLLNAGINDVSISLDACCAADGDRMAGGISGAWEMVVNNLKWITKRVYTTVGIVLTKDNEIDASKIINFAYDCRVHDIRIIPAAQYSSTLHCYLDQQNIIDKYPILKYRLQHFADNHPVRGLQSCDSHKCALVLDDMAVMGTSHYPCIIYLREGGQPIGEMSDDYRYQRYLWFKHHDTHSDPICSKNCLDVCVHYNNTWRNFHDSQT